MSDQENFCSKKAGTPLGKSYTLPFSVNLFNFNIVLEEEFQYLPEKREDTSVSIIPRDNTRNL